MENLIDILESFNRKERYYLLAQVLAHETIPGEAEFKLGANFRQELSCKLDLDIPCNAYVGMDYHLDWLHASLIYFEHDRDSTLTLENNEDVDGDRSAVIKGTQEDTDLLVAFHSNQDQKYHVILIEAKAYSGFTNKQLRSKATRLRQIFSDNGKRYSKVKPHFCLMGPRMSSGLNYEDLPCWTKRNGKPPWIKLTLREERRRVIRKDRSGDIYNKYEIRNEKNRIDGC